MQLKKIWIKNYKNLNNFTLDFENGNNLSILIGNNGSGKSNVLEAISGMFAEAYRDVSNLLESDYTLEYKIEEQNYKIEKINGKRKVYNDDYPVSKKTDETTYLPSNVIAVYSGEDLRLWNNFYWQRYYEYLTSVYKIGYPGKMGMYYVNKYLWNISLFVLLLFADDFENIKTYLDAEIGINDLEKFQIKISFDYDSYDKNHNKLLKQFIDKINPEKELELTFSILDWKKIISEEDSYFSAESNTIFNNFMLAFMPKDFKLIKDIRLYKDGIDIIEALSEGEKKLILIKSVLEFVADEKSLLLLDEPDAHVHEARKAKLYKLLKDTPNRDVVMTTHSPIIAKIADEKELIYLESKEGIVSEVPIDKLKLVRTLASNEWNIMDAGSFLNADKPLVLFEGKSDVDFVKRAIELLKADEPKYGTIDVDYLSFNGTGNAPSFIKNVRDCVATKKIIVFFDRDDAGRNAMVEISGWPKDSDEIKNTIDYISADNLLKAAFYPYTNEVTSGEFLLEDYFSEAKITEIITNLISGKKHPVKGLSNLSKRVKDTLSNKFQDYSKEDFEGFKFLLDKLLELLEIN